MVRASPKIVCVAGRLRRRGVESSISSSLFFLLACYVINVGRREGGTLEKYCVVSVQ